MRSPAEPVSARAPDPVIATVPCAGKKRPGRKIARAERNNRCFEGYGSSYTSIIAMPEVLLRPTTCAE